MNKWEIINKLSEKLKVERYYKSYSEENEPQYIHFYTGYEDNIYPMDVSGYSQIVEINNYYNPDRTSLYGKVNLKKKSIDLHNSD